LFAPPRLLAFACPRLFAFAPPGPRLLALAPPGPRLFAFAPPGPRLFALLPPGVPGRFACPPGPRLFAPAPPGRWALELPPGRCAGAECGALGAGLLGADACGADAWGAGALGFGGFCAEATAVTVKRTSNTDHIGRTFFPLFLEFIATPVRCEALSHKSTAGNSRTNFIQSAIPLMGLFDESF